MVGKIQNTFFEPLIDHLNLNRTNFCYIKNYPMNANENKYVLSPPALNRPGFYTIEIRGLTYFFKLLAKINTLCARRIDTLSKISLKILNFYPIITKLCQNKVLISTSF